AIGDADSPRAPDGAEPPGSCVTSECCGGTRLRQASDRRCRLRVPTRSVPPAVARMKGETAAAAVIGGVAAGAGLPGRPKRAAVIIPVTPPRAGRTIGHGIGRLVLGPVPARVVAAAVPDDRAARRADRVVTADPS